MKIKHIAAGFIAVLLSIGLYAIPVAARDGVPESGSTESHTSDESSNEPTETEIKDPAKIPEKKHLEQKTKIEKLVKTKDVETEKEGLETEGQKEVTELLKKRTKHSDEDRKKNCESAENGLETKLQNLSKNATSFQTRIDTALANATTYQSENNIVVSNYDTLLAAANAAQTKSALTVSALNGLNVNLDCTSSTVAANVAEFKVAAKQARTNLKMYKDSVKALMLALRQAKETK